MTRIRKLICFILAMAFTAFTLPAEAASGNTKIYNLLVDDLLTVAAGTKSATANIEFDNISPDGNSTFKSLKLFAPNGITVTAAQVQAGSSFTASVTVRDASGNIVPPGTAGTAVWVDVINLPVKPFGPAFILTLTVNAACVGTGGPWTTVSGKTENVWTGTGWSGQTFAQNNRSATNQPSYSTLITGQCGTLSFVNQPNNALTGQKITTKSFDPTGSDVTVQTNPATANVSVSVSSAACSISASVTTDSTGLADFATLKSTASTTVTGCTLTATANTFLDSAPSNSFEIAAGATGVLGCSSGNNTGGYYGSLVLTQSGFEGQADWGIVRGNNWGGDLNCTLVPYQFSFNAATGASSFVVDNTIKASQLISAEYVVLFNPVPVSQWPAFHPKVAWGSTFGSTGASSPTPAYPADYVPVLACLDDDINGVNVLPAIPTGTQDFATDYATAAAVGSPPGPGNPQYAAPGTAMMCIANHGWTAMVLGSVNIWNLPAGNYIQPWYKVIDRSDGYLKQ